MRRVSHAALTAVAAVALVPAGALAETWRVGPGQAHTSLREISRDPQLKDGDTIEVDSRGEYCGDVATWLKDALTIRGVGPGRPHLRACGRSEEGKGIWVVRGANFTVENMEFSGAEASAKNGAGIRAEGAGTLTVRNCHFHDNQNGILGGGAQDDTEDPGLETVVVIEGSTFEHNGAGDGLSHNLYISQRVDRLLFRYNVSRGARVGHNLKSRAARNEIICNKFMDGNDGTASFQIDLPNGGLSYVIGNLIQQGPKAENATLLAYANEAPESPNPIQEIYVVHNTFVNTRAAGATFLGLKPQPRRRLVALVRNNVFYGPGVLWKRDESVMVAADYNYVEPALANAPRFVAPEAFDFRPGAGSPLVDAGWDPGSARGVPLLPAAQFVEPAGGEPRILAGKPDIGAFELARH